MKMNWYLYTALWVTAAVLLPTSVVGVVVAALIGWTGMVWASLFTLFVSAVCGVGAFAWKFGEDDSFPLPARPREVKKMRERAVADPQYIAYLEAKQAEEEAEQVRALEARDQEQRRAGQLWLNNDDHFPH